MPDQTPAPKVVVAGASGYVGRRLSQRLVQVGYRVVALSRHTDDLASVGVEIESVDVGDRASCISALAGADVAYYLVHSMAGGSQFAERDRANAAVFGAAARQAGVRRIVYLGGLGDGKLSAHLGSRQEVGEVLRGSGVEVVELRAAVVLGSGSISYEMLRSLTERLPVMVCPRWVDTRLQPLAEADLLTYLEQAIDVPVGIYEIGTSDVTTYRNLMHSYAEVRGLRRRRIVTVPFVTPKLSSLWVDVVSPVDRRVSHALVQSLVAEVVVGDADRTATAFGFRPTTVRRAVRAAMDGERDEVSAGLFDRKPGREGGVYTMRAVTALPKDGVARARARFDEIGGRLDWYPMAWAWRLRILLGRALGESLPLAKPEQLQAGAQVDWWRVARADPEHFELVATDWWFGEGWLGWRFQPGSDRLEQVAAMRPKGTLGFAYWQLLRPIHFFVFQRMVRNFAGQIRRRLAAAPEPCSPPADEEIPRGWSTNARARRLIDATTLRLRLVTDHARKATKPAKGAPARRP